MKFKSDVAGSVTSIRFYKGAGNNGTHTGSLWSSSGTRLATATFANETATGWQTVTFAFPVSINANTTYVASYFAPQGHYAADQNYFTAQRGNAPLHAPASTVNSGNGVFKYGSVGVFPNDTYLSTNYWVDVVFTP